MTTSRQALLTMVMGALFLTACASTPPPDAEIATSAAAVNSAISAGATEAAPNELRMAREKLDKARAQHSAKEYDRALTLAREATVDARLAETKALAAKSSKSATEMKDGNRALAEEINRKSNN